MISISDILNDATDKVLKGIDDFFKDKSESVEKGFTRSYEILPTDKITLFNDILIERCYTVKNDWNSSTPSHNLDNGAVIAETTVKEPVPWAFNCKLTSQDHKEKFKRIIEFRETSQLVTVMFNGEVVENLAIMNISRTIKNVFYTEFTITFKKLTFVEVKTIPAPKMKKIVSEPKKTAAGKEVTKKELPKAPPQLGPVKPQDPNLLNMINPYSFGFDRYTGRRY